MCLLVGCGSGFIEESKDDRALLLDLLISVSRSLTIPQNAVRFSAWREEGGAALNNKKRWRLSGRWMKLRTKNNDL